MIRRMCFFYNILKLYKYFGRINLCRGLQTINKIFLCIKNPLRFNLKYEKDAFLWEKVLIVFVFSFIGSSFAAKSQTTWYSYKDCHLVVDNGQVAGWHNPETWTTTIDGIDSENPAVPTEGSSVVITENTMVYLYQNVTTTGLSIEIRAGATLILGGYTMANLVDLTGKGTLIIENAHFPVISGSNSFGNTTRGTIIYRNITGGNYSFPLNLTKANNLYLEYNQDEITFELGNDLVINGDLILQKSTEAGAGGSLIFNIGNNTTAREINIKGDLTIESGVNFNVSENNAIHEISLWGNLHVDGNLDLTNGSQYSESSSGAAIFNFKGATNNVVSGAGSQLDFYRLIVDKGEDQTSVLDFQHEKLKLYYVTGKSNSGSDPNPIINKALWIKNGTLKLGTGIEIEELSSGGNDFFIPLNGALWIDGAHVETTRSGTGNRSLTVIGTFRITDGYFSTNTAAGIVYRGTAQIIVEGGEVVMSQFRPSSNAGNSHQATFFQSGGVFTVNGEQENNSSFPRFALPLPAHSFTMTGGVINISNPNGNYRGLVIGASPGNTLVTGGVINCTIPSNRDFGITSTPPLYELNVYSNNADRKLIIDADFSYGGVTSTAQPLRILSDLTLHENAHFDANGSNLAIGGDFTLDANAKYTSGDNKTEFFWHTAHGNNITTISISDTNTEYPLQFNDVIFSKNYLDGESNSYASGKNIEFVSAGRNTDPENSLSCIAVFNGNIHHQVMRSKLIFNGFHVIAKGDIIVDDHPTTRSIEWDCPLLKLEGTLQQKLQIKGWYGDGPSKVMLNNAKGAKLMEEAKLQTLELVSGVWHIGSHQFTTNQPVEGSSSFGTETKIQTNGLPGDGGYRLRFRYVSVTDGNPQSFTFPLGVPNKYTPLELEISGTGGFGNNQNYLILKPVDNYHPNLATGDENKALAFYWKTEATIDSGEDLSGLFFSYHFTPEDTDIPGGNSKAHLLDDTGEWKVFDNANPFLFDSLEFMTADFTAGKEGVFTQGTLLPVYYSRANGNWSEPATWSNSGHDGDAAGDYPQSGSIVMIGSGHNISVNNNNESALSVKINSGAVLDLGTTSEHSFEHFTGGGTIRMAGSDLPGMAAGNYDNLHIFHFNDGGTLEFYGASDYDLPTDFLTYHNLTIAGTGTKTLPANEINITGTLTISDQGNLRTYPAGSGVLNINKLSMGSGTANYNSLILSSGAAWTINFKSSWSFHESGDIRVEQNTDGLQTQHTINLLLENGVQYARGRIDLWGNGNTIADLYVKSNTNIDFGDGQYGGEWKLNRLIIDFPDKTHMLRVRRQMSLNSSATGTDKSLELISGTLRLSQRSDDHPYPKNIILSSDDIPFHIPVDAQLIVEGSNKVITSGAAGIDLDGTLLVMQQGEALTGYDDSGNPLQSNNASVIYGTSSHALLGLHGEAQMKVAGQIRRPEESPGAILHFQQTGTSHLMAGAGNPSETRRATFEVLNEGSVFSMEPTCSLTIANGASTSFPALYLEPGTYSSSMGSVFMGSDNTLANQEMGIRSVLDFENLTLEGTNSPVVYLHTQPLTIAGDFTIGENATWQTRELDVLLKGDLLNNGNFAAGSSETLTFGGTNQQVTGNGTTDLNHLTLDIIEEVSVEKDITIAANLMLLRGNLKDNGNIITVRGHINLNGTHSTTGSGKILLQGTSTQEITGNVAAGRWEIDNESGVRSFTPVTISTELILNKGVLDMGIHLLTLKQGATIGNSGNTFGVECMIQTGGSLSDGGIRKNYSSAESSGSFAYPLGVEGKYTPVEIDLTSFSTGRYITIYPVDSWHPTITEDNDINRVLHYYFGVETDSDAGLSADLTFSYDDTDVHGTIGNYYTAQLRPGDNDTWAKLEVTDQINTTDNTITFSHTNQSTSIFNGFYTAGEDTAIPDNVSTYTATGTNSNWNQSESWNGSTVPPSGVIVKIPEGVDVSITDNRKRVYKTIVNGTLNVDPSTTFHNLGLVEGTGKIILQGTNESNPINLPAGRYETFAGCAGSAGTIEFSGAGGLLPASFSNYHHLTISGTGTKTLPSANHLTICGDLILSESVTLDAIAAADQSNPKIISVKGDIDKSTNATMLLHSNDVRMIMNGNVSQTIQGEFVEPNSIANFEVNNPDYLTLSGNVEVSNQLRIIQGRVKTTDASMLSLTNTLPGALADYGTESFVEGPFTRHLPEGSSDTYVFPVGKGFKARFVEISAITSAAAGGWLAEYYDESPAEAGMTAKEAGIESVSAKEYWKVKGPNGASSNVGLQWGAESEISIEEQDLNSLVVVEWGGSWLNKGQNGYALLGDGFGVLTSSNIGFSEKYFTFGTTDPNNPLPVDLLSFDACKSENFVKIEWVTAAEINNDYFSIEKSTDGIHWEEYMIVQSKATRGNSNEVLHYEATDDLPQVPVVYYRLKQTDFDGTFKYSDWEVIRENITSELVVNVFPNPSTGNAFQLFAGGLQPYENVKVCLIGINGQSVYSDTKIANAAGTLEAYIIPSGILKQGVYTLNITGYHGVVSKRMIVQ